MALGFSSMRNATGTVAVYHAIQATTQNREIEAHPVIQELYARTRAMAQTIRALNAAAMRSTLLSLDGAVGAATSEGSLPAGTTISPSNVDQTPQRYSILLEPTDSESHLLPFFEILDQVAGMDPAVTELSPEQIAMISIVARMCLSGVRNTVINDIKSLATSWSNSIGTTGTALDLTKYRTGVDARRDAQVRGRGLSLDARVSGWTPIENDILGLGGAIQYSALGGRTADRTREDSMYTDVHGGTDFMVTTGMPTSGTDTIGETIYPGAMSLELYSTPPKARGATVIMQTPFFTLEELGRSGGSVTKYECFWWQKLSVLQQAAGFKHVHKTAA